MGKGTRNRQVRAGDQATTPSMYARSKHDKQAKTAFWGTVALGIFVIALVLALVFNALTGAGIFLRAKTAVESDDFEVNGAMMSYYMHTAYTSYIDQYSQMYSQIYGSSISSSQIQSMTYAALGIDPNKDLKDQVKDTKTGETWHQYFAKDAATQVESILLYCQAAKIDGVSLDDEDYASIDSQIQMLEIYSQLYGSSFNSYLNSLYGRGVREKDVRKALEYSTLASKYAEQVNEGYIDAATLETVQAFYEKNKNDYTTADYISYVFTAKKNNSEKDTEKAEKDYQTEKAEISAAAEELEKLTTVEEFNKFIKDRWLKDNEDWQDIKTYKDYYDTCLKEATGTDEEKKAEAEKKVKEKLDEDADAYVEARLSEDYAYTTDTELGKWVFGKDDVQAALANERKKIIDDSKDTDTDKTNDSLTITVYFLVRAASRNEDTTRTFSYVMMTKNEKEGSEFNKTHAEAFLTQFKNGDKQDKDALKALAESDAYKSKVSFNSLEELKEGTSGSEEIDEWLYSDERVADDYELITYEVTNSGTTTTYYVLVLIEEIGPEEWYIDARTGMVSEQVEKWEEDQAKILPITKYDKVINKIKL